jgi:DNA-binding LacI/PurR family transcriptional regulator
MNGKTTKTHDLVNSVLRAILAGQYRGGDAIPSERDMAGQIGVSRVTVRRAYAELEKSAILERRQGHGTRIATAVRASTDEIRHVGFLAAGIGPFGLVFLGALEGGVSSIGALLVVKTTEGRPDREPNAAIDLVASGVRNLVIWPSGLGYQRAAFERLRVVGTNMVFFDRICPGAIADFVGLDNRDAVRRLLEHGREAGCDRFHFVGYSGGRADSERERVEAFETWCSEQGVRHALHQVPFGVDNAASLDKARREGLWDGRRPCIVCVNDVLALRLRSRMDGSARLFGIDGIPEAVAAGITTVEQPLARMARVALRLLWEQKVKGARWRAREVRCRGRLIVGF